MLIPRAFRPTPLGAPRLPERNAPAIIAAPQTRRRSNHGSKRSGPARDRPSPAFACRRRRRSTRLRAGRCCAQSDSRMPILRSPRSASPPPGAWSRRATCTSTCWHGTRVPAPTQQVRRAFCSTRLRYPTVSQWHARHALLTRVARGHRGLDRSCRAVHRASTASSTIGGCDKNMPGCVMAMARLNRPSIFVYGGTIQPGPKRRDIVSVFEAVGALRGGKDRRRRAQGSGVDRHSGSGLLRRNVHGQHDGLGDRGAWPEFGEQLGTRSRLECQGRRLSACGRSRRRADQARHQTVGHPDAKRHSRMRSRP